MYMHMYVYGGWESLMHVLVRDCCLIHDSLFQENKKHMEEKDAEQGKMRNIIQNAKNRINSQKANLDKVMAENNEMKNKMASAEKSSGRFQYFLTF